MYSYTDISRHMSVASVVCCVPAACVRGVYTLLYEIGTILWVREEKLGEATRLVSGH